MQQLEEQRNEHERVLYELTSEGVEEDVEMEEGASAGLRDGLRYTQMLHDADANDEHTTYEQTMEMLAELRKVRAPAFCRLSPVVTFASRTCQSSLNEHAGLKLQIGRFAV